MTTAEQLFLTFVVQDTVGAMSTGVEFCGCVDVGENGTCCFGGGIVADSLLPVLQSIVWCRC